MLHDRLHDRVDKEIHLEGVVTLSRPVDVLHVPLQFDVKTQVNIQGLEDELQRREGLVVIISLLLESLGSS